MARGRGGGEAIFKGRMLPFDEPAPPLSWDAKRIRDPELHAHTCAAWLWFPGSRFARPGKVGACEWATRASPLNTAPQFPAPSRWARPRTPRRKRSARPACRRPTFPGREADPGSRAPRSHLRLMALVPGLALCTPRESGSLGLGEESEPPQYRTTTPSPFAPAAKISAIASGMSSNGTSRSISASSLSSARSSIALAMRRA